MPSTPVKSKVWCMFIIPAQGMQSQAERWGLLARQPSIW